jgi:hypothetical protein
MSLTLHGSNGITFPDTTGPFDGADLSAGKVLQAVLNTYLTQGSLTAIVPADDTKPQSSEGTQILTSGAITPGHANNYIQITIHMGDFYLPAGYASLAIFDGGTDAVWCRYGYTAAPSPHIWTTTAGSTSARTYTVKTGPSGSEALVLNTSAYMGAGMAGEESTWMLVEEIQV